MATRITDNSDIIAYEYLLDYDIESLTTERLRNESPPWASRHERAWSEILRRLSMRPDALEESDLSDTSEFDKASCLYVCYLACKQSRSQRHADMADEFFRMFQKEMEELEPTTSSGTAPRSSWRFMRGARG